MAIKLAGMYLEVNAVPVHNEDHTAEIIRDFVLGFTGMKKGEFGIVLRSLEDPHAKERIVGAICDASWAGARKTRDFY